MGRRRWIAAFRIVKKEWGKLKKYGTNFEDVKLEDYLEIEKDVYITEHTNDDDILERVRKKHRVENADEEENSEDERECLLKLSTMKAFEMIRRVFQFQENLLDAVFNSLQICELLLLFIIYVICLFTYFENKYVLWKYRLFLSIETFPYLIVQQYHFWFVLHPHYYVAFYGYFNNLIII